MIAGRIVRGYSKEQVLSRIWKTQSLYERMKGLIGFRELEEGEGLLINSCNSVHTFFMRMDIDVVFLNRKNIVVQITNNLKPQRLAMSCKASSVLELGAGQAESFGLRTGDHLEWEELHDR